MSVQCPPPHSAACSRTIRTGSHSRAAIAQPNASRMRIRNCSRAPVDRSSCEARATNAARSSTQGIPLFQASSGVATPRNGGNVPGLVQMSYRRCGNGQLLSNFSFRCRCGGSGGACLPLAVFHRRGEHVIFSGSMYVYAATVFLSAFLLFQIQPIIGKAILPWFGGSAGVWATCMVFFQTALLLGYLYADWLARRLPPRWQYTVHGTLLALSLAALPVAPNPAWKPDPQTEPVWRILALLAGSVGLPYFILSTTSPLIQALYARRFRAALPYRLFARSEEH